jgi:hypothetical protein
MSIIPDSLRVFVRVRAGYRCQYCQASEWLAGQRFHVDHIIPLAEGGLSAEDNLCLACPMCNGSKLSRMDGIDPETGERSSLFHPRRQAWAEHFRWSEDGLRALGLTPCGRATVDALRINHRLAQSARAVWVSADKHPPRA